MLWCHKSWLHSLFWSSPHRPHQSEQISIKTPQHCFVSFMRQISKSFRNKQPSYDEKNILQSLKNLHHNHFKFEMTFSNQSRPMQFNFLVSPAQKCLHDFSITCVVACVKKFHNCSIQLTQLDANVNQIAKPLTFIFTRQHRSWSNSILYWMLCGL